MTNPLSDQSKTVVVDVQRFKEAVWAVERESFRPGDALTALERATIQPASNDGPFTSGQITTGYPFDDRELQALNDLAHDGERR